MTRWVDMISTFTPRPHFFETINMPNLKQMTLALAIAAAATVGTSASAAVDATGSTNLVTNGAFENGLTGWTKIGYPSVETFDGSSSVVFLGNPNEGGAGISQLVGTIQAGIYTFTFKTEVGNGYPTSGFVGSSAYGADAIIQGGSYEYMDLHRSAFVDSPDYGPLNVSFVQNIGANSALIGKSLFVGFTGYSGDHIDNVALTFTSAVPEPESSAMLLAGLGLVGAVSRRRRAPA
jgi:hypothetical protein